MNNIAAGDLLTQLKVAVSAVKERSNESLQAHVAYFNKHKTKALELLDLWKRISVGHETVAECPPADTLHFLLMIESIWFRTAQTCIENIHDSVVNGRAALYCISEIRLALNRTTRLVVSKREVRSIMVCLRELGEACLAPTLEDSGNINTNSFSSCLELLPTIADGLYHLQKQYDDSEDSDPLDELISSMFFVEWDLSLLLPLSSILCELYPYLSIEHLGAFKSKLLKSIKELQTQSEDFAGVIRVALRLFEQSNDVRWVYVLRTLYRAIPERSIATVEALLEQIFTQSVQVAKLLLGAMEDTAVSLGHAVVTHSYQKKVNIEGIVAEYDGVPEISLFDVRLALIITRAIFVSSCCTNSSSGTVSLNNISEIALPLVLSAAQMEADASNESMIFEAQLCCRSVLMLVLCCVSLELAQELRFETYNRDSITVTLNTVLKQTILPASAQSGGWLSDARAQELLKHFLQVGAYPEITSMCLATVNGWFAESQEQISAETEEDTDGNTEEDGERNGDTEACDSTERDQVQRVVPPPVLVGPGPKLLTSMIVEVFSIRQNLRAAVLTCVLKGIVCCATSGSSTAAKHGTGGRSEQRNVPSSSSAAVSAQAKSPPPFQQSSPEHGTSAAVSEHFEPIHDLLQDVFARLCADYSEVIAQHSEVIETHFPAVVQAPAVTHSFLRSLTAVCASSTSIFAIMHAHLFKQMQAAEPCKIVAAVRIIVPLLFAVSAPQQAEVLNLIANVLSRSAVFAREACILLIQQLDAPKRVTGTAQFVSVKHWPFLPHLQELIANKLEDCFSKVAIESKASSCGHQQSEENVRVFDPSLCLAQIGGAVGWQISEDIEHCILLSWKLEMLSNSNELVQGVEHLAEQIAHFDNTASNSADIPGPRILQDMWGVILYVARGFPASAKPAKEGASLGTRAFGSPVAPSSSASKEESTQLVVLPPSATRLSPRPTEPERLSEAQACELVVAYAAVSAVLKCLVEASGAQGTHSRPCHMGAEGKDHASGHRANDRQFKDKLLFAILSLAAVMDVLYTLLAEVTNISTVRQCLQYYQARVLGMSSLALPLSKGSNVTEYAVAPCVALSVNSIQKLLSGALSILSDGAHDKEHLPLSIRMGVLIHLVNFVRDTTRPLPNSSNDSIANTDAATALVAAKDTTKGCDRDHSELFQTLLTLYKAMCAVALEEDCLQQQADYYRQYIKYIRKITGQAPAVSRHSKRHKKSVRYDDQRDQEEADGRIDSDSDGDIMSDREDSLGRQGSSRSSGSLAGFQMSALLPDRAIVTFPQCNSSEDHQPYSGAVSVHSSSRADEASRKHAPGRVRMDLISRLDEESPCNKEQSLWQCALLGASKSVRAEFKRWDVHFVEEAGFPTTTTTARGAPDRERQSQQAAVYSVLDNKLSPFGLHNEVRTALFNVRSEIITAIAVILSTSPAAALVINEGGAKKQNTTSAALQLSSYFAGEVLQSMKHGILVRAFNAYTRLLQELHRAAETAIFAAHKLKVTSEVVPPYANVVNCELTSSQLWQTLRHLHTALPQIVSPIVQMALKYRETCAGIQDCAAVLLSLGHQRFAHKIDDNSSVENSDAEDSAGSDTEGARSSTTAAARSHRAVRHHHKRLIDGESAADDRRGDASKAANTGTGDQFPIIVTEAVADLVAKDAIKHLSNTLQMISKQPEMLTNIKDIICPEVQDPTQYVYLCAGHFCVSLFALFAEAAADDETVVTGTKSTKNTTESLPARGSSKSSRKTEPVAASSKIMLIDQFSEARISQVLEVLTKILSLCTKECVVLLKSAILIRKVTNFVARTNRLEQHGGNKVLNTFEDWEDEDPDEENGPEHSASGAYDGYNSDSERAPDAVDLQLARLHSGRCSHPAPTYVLFGLLSSVPTALVANLETWLVQRITSCPKRPSKACVAIIKRTQQAYTALDLLCSQMFAIVKETNKKYDLEGLNNVKDPRLMELWNAAQNPSAAQAIALVAGEGKNLLGSLGINAEGDSGGNGGVDDEDTVVDTHRRSTLYRGRESLRLNGVAGVSRTSALNAHRLASMAAAARSGGNKRASAKQQVLVSRNSVIQDWFGLDGGSGGDNYADLEEFLVYE